MAIWITDDITYDDVVLLVEWLADNHYETATIVTAVEKPWKFMDELQEARDDLAAEIEGERVREGL